MIKFLTLILLFSFTACQWSEDRHIKRDVSSDELLGEWGATPFAMECLKKTGHKNYLNVNDHRLVLYEDGTCEFKSIQNLDVALGRDPDPNYMDISNRTLCQWKLNKSSYNGQLQQNVSFSFTPKSKINGSPMYYLGEDEGKITLWQYCADPDFWKYMEFQKTKK